MNAHLAYTSCVDADTHTHTTLLREQYLRESVMSTQQPLSVKTMLGIRAQIHIQWTSLRDRRHRSAHTEIRTHLTHTHKTNELPKLASRVEMFLFLQYLYLFIIFVCTCVCAYECVHHSIGPVGHCLTQPGAAIMKTLLRLPNWHSTPSH